MLKYAFAHPGKIGDLLYILPTVHKICERDGAIADIYTSSACIKAERLFRAQPHINDFIIPTDYVIQSFGQGVQPWNMNIPAGYDKVFQLGYKDFPHGPLHLSIARTAGLTTVDNPSYVYPNVTFFDEPYIVIGHASHHSYGILTQAYQYVIEHIDIKTIQTGVAADWVGGKSVNLTNLDLLTTVSLMAKAKAFLGFYSGLLALANGLPITKLITLQCPDPKQHGLHLPGTFDIYQPADGPTLLKFVEEHL
jgi:hypothetical protein